MLVTRTSSMSGITRTLDLNITQEQLEAWQNGGLIQRVMPHLSADDREFIISGVTSDEWANLFKDE